MSRWIRLAVTAVCGAVAALHEGAVDLPGWASTALELAAVACTYVVASVRPPRGGGDEKTQ